MPYNPEKVLVPRAAMPQIKSTRVVEFLEELRSEDVLVLRNATYPKWLRKSQKEIHEAEVEALMEKPEQLEKPIMISRDMFVLDGHHRWQANLRLNRLQPIWFIDMDAAEVLSAMARFSARHPEDCGAKQ